MAGPEDRLELTHVIESMSKLPKDKEKILILEGAQVPANWRLGMLHNDFARHLERLEREIRKVPHLWVLSAADVDQRCWASDGLRRTVFSHYLIEALRGKAAQDPSRLTLRQLHDYVRKNVRSWVWNAQGTIQEPVLLPGVARDEGRQAEGRASDTQRAPERAAQVSLATVTNAPAFTEPSNPDRTTLQGVWQGFDRLNTSVVPHPSVYSPRRWRRYQAEVVRFEELVRAGAESKAEPVRSRITELEGILESDRFLNDLPGSVENTLAMNVLTGGAIETRSDRPPAFLQFWTAPRGLEAGKTWESLASSDKAGDDALPSLRIRTDEFLLQMAIRDPAKNLESAAEKLEITNRRSNAPQPAEVHLLRMIHRWFFVVNQTPPSSEVWGLIGRALSVRRLAERAAAGASKQADLYSRGEQVNAWNKALVEAGDKSRRIGEDLLFSSEQTAWKSAGKALDEAKRSYDDAIARSAIVRTALAARDRALAVLPAYTRWLANRDSDELWNNLEPKLEALWATTHQLAVQLEKPSDDVGSFAKAVTTLLRDLEDLSRRFKAECSQRGTVRSKDDWQAASAAAAVPLVDANAASLRSDLWDRLDNIRARQGAGGIPDDRAR